MTTTLVVVIVAVLVVSIALVVVRVITEPIPAITVTRVAPVSLQFPGPAPTLAWPAEGQAAVAVEDVGSFGAMGGDTPVPIASLAKIMTAYLTLQEHPLAVGATGFTYTVTAADVADQQARLAQDESTVPVSVGETLSEYQLLQALLIPSGNNIAAIVATYDAGSQAAFVTKMNATAFSLGMGHTTYTDPSGFDDSTVSTAADQLILAQVAMRNPVFAQIVAMPSATLPVTGTVLNYDAVVGTDGFVGIKTGSDSQANGCFAFADDQTVDGHKVVIVGVVLDQGQGPSATIIGAALTAASNLSNSVRAGMRSEMLVRSGTEVARAIGVDGHTVNVVTTTSLTQLGWGGLRVPVHVTVVRLGTHLHAGQTVAHVSLGPSPAATAVTAATTATGTTATAAATMPPPSLVWRLQHLL